MANGDLQARAQELFTDPEFQSLEAPEQVEVFRRAFSRDVPELDELSEPELQDVFLRLSSEAVPRPGLLGRALGAAGTAAQVIVPPLARGLEEARGAPEEVSPGTRLFTRGLEAVTDPGGAIARRALGRPPIEENVLSTAAGRFAAGAAREIVQLGGEFAVAGPAGRAIAGPLRRAGGAALSQAFAGGGAEAGRQAARAFSRADFARFASEGGIAGLANTVVNAAERGELPSAPELVVGSLGVAAFGAGIVPARRLIQRFGFTPGRVQEGTQALQGSERLQGFVREGQQLARAIERSSGVDRKSVV